MFVVASFNNENMEDMAQITDKVKERYCDKHSYLWYCKKNNWHSSDMGFARVHLVNEIFNNVPDTEWIFLVDCDAIITNTNIKIEDRIDNNFHAIYTVYHNGLNVGVALFRNSPEGRKYINDILSIEGQYINHPWKEQQAIIDNYDTYKSITKIVPARFMNSLQAQLYDKNQLSSEFDLSGNSMLWQPGDWALHWPGVPHKYRIEQAKIMVNNIWG
ncbi:MAG: hypothetical protein NTZ20_04700 [Candidatus Levybacteria bacterium]|nr:hypothetical protein [Candidatus Levybacteria bacterium]